MEIKIKKISSIIDGIRTMYMSKRTWNPQFEDKLDQWESNFIDSKGGIIQDVSNPDFEEFNKAVKSLFKWGQKHITMLRFIDITCVVDGLHRGATDEIGLLDPVRDWLIMVMKNLIGTKIKF